MAPILIPGWSFSSILAIDSSKASSLAPHLVPNKEWKWESENKVKQWPFCLSSRRMYFGNYYIMKLSSSGKRWQLLILKYLKPEQKNMHQKIIRRINNLGQMQADLIFESFSNHNSFCCSVKNSLFRTVFINIQPPRWEVGSLIWTSSPDLKCCESETFGPTFPPGVL